MILSESEKNRIKSMYGLVTEDDTSAPPPDESVLITKKNPFNLPKEIYDKILTKYVTAVDFRTYNKGLKDGEYFLKTDRICLDNFIWEKIKPVLDSLTGKSVRGNNDNFLYFKEVNDSQRDEISYKMFNISPNSVYAPTLLNFFLKDDVGRTLRYSYMPEKDSFISSDGDLSPESYDKLLKFLSDNLKPLLDIKKFPDNCFEIREIKREKTDF